MRRAATTLSSLLNDGSKPTQAIGITSKSGRYGGTYAHRDIAFEFASWISSEFKLYLIKEFQRLKDDENRRLSLAWNLNRTLSKLNYRIHTDAIKAHLIPPEVTPAQAAITYATEADLLNVAPLRPDCEVVARRQSQARRRRGGGTAWPAPQACGRVSRPHAC